MNLLKTSVLALTCSTACLAFTAAAQAATISQTVSSGFTGVPPTPRTTDWQETVNFNLFNRSLGILNSVTIEMDGVVIGSGSIKNNSSFALRRGTYSLSAGLELLDATGTQSLGTVQPIFNDTFSLSNSLAAGATRTYSPTVLTATETYTYLNGDPLLSYFIGRGVGSFLTSAFGASGWNGPSNVTTTFNTSAAVNYTITYDYEAVPEPLTLLGVGTALGFGTLFKRNLAKKSNKA